MIQIPEIINEKVPITFDNGIELYIKREDKTHPKVSGNKFRKLKYNLQEAKAKGYPKIITFGGAYSNHISATAAAGQIASIPTIGVIRGDELRSKISENPTLRYAQSCGMEFDFVSRTDFRQKHTNEFKAYLKEKFGDFYYVPEGGTNSFAVKGCEEILIPEDNMFNFITTAVGTGGTISGLINSSQENQKILGFPALNGRFLEEEIKKMTTKHNWKLIHSYNLGGYAKINDEFIHFLNDFYDKTNIPLDPIYTGKMIFGIFNLIEKQFFPKNSKILAIHTGGLQGIFGINQKLKKQNKEILHYENKID
ncbi:MAG: pyridoxal-phosphate dependent enzyme [Capnocytophaga sp.]|nr:pyridoxal-phosphate dependent enzyme [Capnocytophaga sp.]